MEVISIITKWILNGLGHLQPAKEEDELKDEEDWDEGVGFTLLMLASNQRQGKVDPNSKPLLNN